MRGSIGRFKLTLLHSGNYKRLRAPGRRESVMEAVSTSR